jgi:MFS family permease
VAELALISMLFDAILSAMPQGPGNREAENAEATPIGSDAPPSAARTWTFSGRLKSICGIPLLLFLFAVVLFARNIPLFRPVIPYGLLSNYHPWKAAAYDSKAQENPELYDQVFQFYPWWNLISAEVKAGRVPLWNPYSFCGSPLLANGQSGVFYPLNIFNWMLDLNAASLLLAVGKLFVAAIFTYAFLRQLSLGRSSALFGAVAFAFSRNIVVWLGFPAGSAAVLLPALFWACERLIQCAGIGNFILAALLVGAQLLAGQPQASLVALLCLSTYVVIRLLSESMPWGRRLRTILLYGGAWGFAFLLAAIQLLPLIEYLQESAAMPLRTQFNIKFYPWYELLSFVLPNFFGTPYENNYWGFANLVGTACYLGVAPLLLALLSARRAFKPGNVQTFWIISLLGLSVVYKLPFLGRISSLPLFIGVDTNKYLVAVVFSLAVCSACELDGILQQDLRKTVKRITWWAVSLLGLALLAVFGFRDFFSAMDLWPYELSNLGIFVLFALICLGLFLVASRKKLSPAALAAGLIVLTFTDLFVFGHSVNASARREELPKPPDSIQAIRSGSEGYRILGVQGVLPANASILYGLADVRGYDAMTPARYYEFLSRVDRGYADLSSAFHFEQGDSIDRSTLFKRELLRILQAGGQPLQDLLKKTYYWNTDLDGLLGTSALDALGVKYILAPPGTRSLPTGTFNLIQKGQAAVFENPRTLPRCYLRNRFTVVDDAQALETIGASGFDFSQDLLLSHVTENGRLQTLFSAAEPKNLDRSRAEIVSQNANSVEISVRADEPVVLVLADLYFPGWEAVLDNQPVPVYAANYIFRAVVVPAAGVHTVQFHYRPRSFSLGVGISLLALCVCAALSTLAGIRGLHAKRDLTIH